MQEYVKCADPKRMVKWMVDALVPPASKRKTLKKQEMDIHTATKKNAVLLQVVPGAVEKFHGVGTGYGEGNYVTKI